MADVYCAMWSIWFNRIQMMETENCSAVESKLAHNVTERTREREKEPDARRIHVSR